MEIHSGRLRLIAAIGLAGAIGVSAAGQGAQDPEQPQPPAIGLIAGQVVDATSGKPIGDVAVTVTALSPDGIPIVNGPGGAGAPRQVLTSSEGQFVFHSLRKGVHTIRANAPGYVMAGPGQHRPSGPIQPIFLAADDTKAGGITIRMWKMATISGTVIDEAGEPIVGLPISVMRRTFVSLQPRFANAFTASTDDRGMYRVLVAPGDYLVTTQSTQTTLPASVAEAYVQAISAGGNITTNEVYREFSSSGVMTSTSGYRVGDLLFQGGGGRGGAAPPTPVEAGKLSVYPSTTYPSAPTLAQGTVITLGSGENRAGVDLQLRLTPSVRVSGTVTGPEGPARNLGIRLYAQGADAIAGFSSNPEAATTATDANGVFTFLGVTPGQYTLKIARVPRPPATPLSSSNMTTVEIGGAGGMMMMGISSGGPNQPPPPPLPTDPTWWATMPVTVGDNDVANLNVALRGGARISGRVQFEGTKPPPPPDQVQRTIISITTSEPRSFSVPSPLVRVDAEGRFTSNGFPGGRYQVSGNVITAAAGGVTTAGSDWTFKSATLNGRNLADDPLDIDAEDISGLVVTFTDRTSSLSGAVTDSAGRADPAAEIVIFPADSQGWKTGIPNPRRVRVARASQTGSYQFGSIPAGEYYVSALNAASMGDSQDPKFLEKLVPVASKVMVGDGERRVENLTSKEVK